MQKRAFTLPQQRLDALRWLNNASDGVVVEFRKGQRSGEQNRRFWAMLGDLSKQAEHNGRKFTADQWKYLVMHACGHEVQFMNGLNGEPFPAGFRSSKLNKEQMSELMEFMSAYGAENGVVFREPVG